MKDPEQERLKEMWRRQELAAGRNPDRWNSTLTWAITIAFILLGMAIAHFTR